MTTIKYKVCDRCGEKIEGFISNFLKKPYRFEAIINDEHKYLELCDKCGIALKVFISNPAEEKWIYENKRV